MDGVKILSTYSCNAYEPGTILAFFAITMIMFLISCLWYSGEHSKRVAAVCGMVIAAFVFLCTYIVYTEVNNKWDEYAVIVSDDVSYNEFTDKYEIVGTDGEILRVRERQDVS